MRSVIVNGILAAAIASVATVASAATTVTYQWGQSNALVSAYAGEFDTYLVHTSPNTNKNGAGSLAATSLDPLNEYLNSVGSRTVVSFTNLNLPANAVITSATLQMYAYSATDGNNNDGQVMLAVSTLLRPFVDSTATWNSVQTGTETGTTAPAISTNSYAFDQGYDIHTAESSATIATTSFVPGYINFDVTASLQAQYNANKYYGWLIGGLSSNGNDGQALFRDREIGGSTRPTLVVTYAVPEPASLGLLGLAGGLLLIRRRK